MTPFLTGRGWGWVVCLAAEAVSQFPGPPLEDPPTSPPRNSTGAQLGGARWDDWRTGCPLPPGGAASRPLCQLDWRSGCSAADRRFTSSGGSAADVPPREPKASDWRGGRAADRWLYNGEAADRWLCSGEAAAWPSRLRRPDRIRVRDGSPTGARRWAFDSGSTRSATARPRAAGTRPDPRRPGATTCTSGATTLNATPSATRSFTPSVDPARRFANFEYFE